MGQQFFHPAGPVRGQPREHDLEVGIGVMPVHPGRLHQTHHGRRTLARAQAAGKQPVIAANGNRPDLVLDPVVVHGQLPVIDEARQRSPAPEAVIQCPGRRRAVRQLLPLQGHPLVQCIEHRFTVLLPDGLALIGVQLLDLAFDVVNLGELLQCEPGDLAFVGRMQVKEFAPGVRQATHLGHATGDQGLVAGEVVAGQRPFPVAQEVAGVLTGPGFAEVVDNGLHVFEHPWCVDPQVGPVRSSLARLEHLHRRFVGVQDAAGEYFGLQRIEQRLQPYAAGADPLRQGRAGNGQTGACKDGFLAEQRQMVGVLGHQHLGQQTRGGDAFVDHMGLDRCLSDGFALRARPLAADVALHREHARHIVEFLGHVFTDAFHRTATGAGGRLGLVADFASRQVGWQRLAFGLLFDFGGDRRWLELLDLQGDGRQVGLDLVFEQAALLGVEALGLGGELHALEQRVLVGEFGVERLAVLEFGLVTGDLRILVSHVAHEAGDYLAQLLCAEIVQGLLLHHHGSKCVKEGPALSCADPRIARWAGSRTGFRPW